MLFVFSLMTSLVFSQWYLWIVVIILLIRNFCLYNKTWFVVLLALSLLTLGRTFSVKQQTLKHQSLNFPEEIQAKLITDPGRMSHSPGYLTGPGQLWIAGSHEEPLMIPVQASYWYQEDEEQELSLITEKLAVLDVKANIKKPDPARNFGVFNYQSYLSYQNIDWTVAIEEIDQIVWLEAKFFDSPKLWWINQRRYLTHFLRSFEEIPLVGLHNKLFFNLDSPAYRNYKEEFAKLGILHYFSISGFHIYFIRKGLTGFLLRLGIEPDIVQGGVFFFLCFYGSLIAWPIGVIRSVSVYYSGKAAKKLNLAFSSFDILSLVCLILLLINPYYVTQLGFILSFLMTYLITFYQQNKEVYAQNLVQTFKNNFELTLLCLLFSWPLLLNSNAEWIPVQLGILLVFAVIFEKGVMPLMFAITGFLFLGQQWEFFIKIISVLSNIFENSRQLISIESWQNKFSVITGVRVWWEIALLWLAAISWLSLIKKSGRKRRAYCLIGVSYFFIIFLCPLGDFTTRLTILDVGQGDTLLYQPAFSNAHWLIDTGGRVDWQAVEGEEKSLFDNNFAKRNLLPALRALGVNHITGLIITHPDGDHLGNLEALAQELSIKQIYLSQYTYESSAWQDISKQLRSQTNLAILPAGSEIKDLIKGLTLFSLPLTKYDYFDPDISNNSSLITQIEIGGMNFLNMGDLAAEKEKELIKLKPHLQIDLLKLGHHGSKTSSCDEFISHYHPDIAFISAGADNRYGHPHPEVIEGLNRLSIPFLSTSSSGAVQITYHPIWGIKIKQAMH